MIPSQINFANFVSFLVFRVALFFVICRFIVFLQYSALCELRQKLSSELSKRNKPGLSESFGTLETLTIILLITGFRDFDSYISSKALVFHLILLQ